MRRTLGVAIVLLLGSARGWAQEAPVRIRVAPDRPGAAMEFAVTAPNDAIVARKGGEPRDGASGARMSAPAELFADLTRGPVEIKSLVEDQWISVVVSGGRATITASGERLRISLEKGRLEVRGLPPERPAKRT